MFHKGFHFPSFSWLPITFWPRKWRSRCHMIDPDENEIKSTISTTMAIRLRSQPPLALASSQMLGLASAPLSADLGLSSAMRCTRMLELGSPWSPPRKSSSSALGLLVLSRLLTFVFIFVWFKELGIVWVWIFWNIKTQSFGSVFFLTRLGVEIYLFLISNWLNRVKSKSMIHSL